MTASLIATLAGAGYAVADADALMPRRSPMPPPARDDAGRIAAAEAKRARKNAKRAQQAPTTGEGQ
jgi:hypothetical protein